MNTSRFPVDTVSWFGAAEFCNRVSAARGLVPRYAREGGWKEVASANGYRLPTEDEWEYACRGGRGNRQPFSFGDELNGGRANCDGGSPYGMAIRGPNIGRTTAVGEYETRAAHPWGLCDMHGNVWEWCESRKNADRRAQRGGSWATTAQRCRSAYRDQDVPDRELNSFGFRVLLPAD